MKTHEALANAAAFIASRRQAAHLEGRADEERLWLYLRSLSNFIHSTGQVYQFEDFLKAAVSSERPRASARLGTHKVAQLAVELLLRSLDKTSEYEQKQHVLLLIALVNFIADTGQLDDVEDFFNNQLEYAPIAIAHFTSRGEAEAWLKGVAEPRAQPTSSLAMNIINSGIGVRTIRAACIATIQSNRSWRD